MALTFRISNIPFGVSKEDFVKDLTGPVGENTVSLRSIAPSPCGFTKGQVAIATFNPVPPYLEEATHGIQQLKIPMMKGTSFGFIANFDSHFIGLTPLNEVSSSASFEYFTFQLFL